MQDNNMPGKDALTALANEIKALDKGVKKLEKFAKKIGTDRDSRKTRKKLTEAHVDCITRAKQLQKRFRELAEDADTMVRLGWSRVVLKPDRTFHLQPLRLGD